MWGKSGRRSRGGGSATSIHGPDGYERRSRRSGPGRVSLGGSLTGLMVALSCTFVFAFVAGALLRSQGHDLSRVVWGRAAWASPGAGTMLVAAVFMSFLWGGYTAGRMGAGAGAANGGLVPGIALIVLAALGAFRLVVQDMDSFRFPFGIGNLPLDGNFTSLGIAVVAGVAVAMIAGGIWGGILGARWHLRLNEEVESAYESSGTDSFTDLVGGRSRYQA